jgi:hypothetical protein
MRPAYLSATQEAGGLTHFEFRQPDDPSRKWLIAETSCSRLTEHGVERSPGSMLHRWDAQCEPGGPFVISVLGLAQTTTDVLVDFRSSDGTLVSFVIRPDHPAVSVGPEVTPGLPVYLELGIEHLLSGYDHLLFLVGLMLLVKSGWMLIKTITSFTVAHSITLALAALEIVSLPQGPIEAAIALSILYVALEAVNDEPGPTAHYPWIIAFLFGLLHGLGFAGVLREIGLPEGQFVSALLLFNLGIEIGQLLVVVAIMALAWIARRQLPRITTAIPVGLVTAYVIGSTAVYWILDRVTGLWPGQA